MKKTTKRLFTMLLAVVLLFVNANFAFAIEFASSGTDVEEPTFYNATSSTLDLSLYFDVEEFTAYLIEQMELLEGDTSTYATMSIRNFNIPRTDAIRLAITELIFYNTPELFRIKRLEFGYSGGYYTSIRCLCFYTRAEYVEMHADMLAVTEKLVKGIKDNPSLTDVEKALLLHDRLAMHCEYDYDTYLENQGILPQTSYNAYGALVLRDAVCMGYALAYDFLLEQVGIKSLYCSSDTINHAWNIVYINNIPYHVDVTWDDPIWDTYGLVTHENFLLSTSALKATGHSASDFLSFPNDTTYENYYWKESESAFQLIDGEYYYYDNSYTTFNLIDAINGPSSSIYPYSKYNDGIIIKNSDSFEVKYYLRKVIKMEHNTIIDDAFLVLRSKHEMLAIVEENGEYKGIVTIEDIVEEVVGNMFDEYDEEIV